MDNEYLLNFFKNNRYLHMKADLSQLHKLVKDLWKCATVMKERVYTRLDESILFHNEWTRW